MRGPTWLTLKPKVRVGYERSNIPDFKTKVRVGYEGFNIPDFDQSLGLVMSGQTYLTLT